MPCATDDEYDAVEDGKEDEGIEAAPIPTALLIFLDNDAEGDRVSVRTSAAVGA